MRTGVSGLPDPPPLRWLRSRESAQIWLWVPGFQLPNRLPVCPRATPLPTPPCLSLPTGKGQLRAALQVTHLLPGLDWPPGPAGEKPEAGPRAPRSPGGRPQGRQGARERPGGPRAAAASPRAGSGGRPREGAAGAGGAGGRRRRRRGAETRRGFRSRASSLLPRRPGPRRPRGRRQAPGAARGAAAPRHGARVSAARARRPRTTWRRRRPGHRRRRRRCYCSRCVAAWPPPRVGGRGPQGQWPGRPGSSRGPRPSAQRAVATLQVRGELGRAPRVLAAPRCPRRLGAARGPLSQPSGPLSGTQGPVQSVPGRRGGRAGGAVPARCGAGGSSPARAPGRARKCARVKPAGEAVLGRWGPGRSGLATSEDFRPGDRPGRPASGTVWPACSRWPCGRPAGSEN